MIFEKHKEQKDQWCSFSMSSRCYLQVPLMEYKILALVQSLLKETPTCLWKILDALVEFSFPALSYPCYVPTATSSQTQDHSTFTQNEELVLSKLDLFSLFFDLDRYWSSLDHSSCWYCSGGVIYWQGDWILVY